MSNKIPLPYFFSGKVVPGFQRGSRELGCPTANMSEDVVNNLPTAISNAVYYGLAKVGQGRVHKMVMSIGTNPTYKNERKTVEVHIIHNFDKDLYGETVDAVVLGFLRDMIAFKNIDELKEAIQKDIQTAVEKISEMDIQPIVDRYFLSQEKSHL